MKQQFRLRRSSDITRVRREGKSYANLFMVMFVLPDSRHPYPRVGISVSRRLGNAVRRNRIKRRLRACCDQVLPCLEPGWDILVVARQPLGEREVSFADLQSAVSELFVHAGLLNNDGC